MIILHIHFPDTSETYRTVRRMDINRDTKEFYIWYERNTGEPDEKVSAARVDTYIPGLPRILHTYIM